MWSHKVSDRQLAYCRHILRFRKALNLTSVDSLEGLVTRFILPSVALEAWIGTNASLLDIGSGMGIPGIPLLIARPDLSGVLVDRRMKRVEFLRHVVRALGLKCRVYCADAAKVRLDVAADVVVARAVANPTELLRLSAPLVRRGGEALLPTGSSVAAEGVDSWCALDRVALQFGDGSAQPVLRYRRL